MINEMDKDGRIALIILILLAVAVLATLWSLHVTGVSLERQMMRRRWGLTESQMVEIEQLIEKYHRGEIDLSNLRRTLWSRFSEWGVVPPPPMLDVELFYTIKAVLSTVNTVIVLMLLFIYVNIYRKTKTNFTVGLIIFSLILLLYTVSSNPILQTIFGYRAFGLGPFAMLPDTFTFVALLVLLYLSLK